MIRFDKKRKKNRGSPNSSLRWGVAQTIAFLGFSVFEAILAGFITIGIYLTWRIISKLWVFNTAYIGLFDRSLLHMSLKQLELALKNTTFKSRTPVSMYQFDPFFLFFSMMKKVRKGSYRKGHPLCVLLSFRIGVRAWKWRGTRVTNE